MHPAHSDVPCPATQAYLQLQEDMDALPPENEQMQELVETPGVGNSDNEVVTQKKKKRKRMKKMRTEQSSSEDDENQGTGIARERKRQRKKRKKRQRAVRVYTAQTFPRAMHTLLLHWHCTVAANAHARHVSTTFSPC